MQLHYENAVLICHGIPAPDNIFVDIFLINCQYICQYAKTFAVQLHYENPVLICHGIDAVDKIFAI